MSTITLVSNDNQSFEVSSEVAFLSETIKNLVEDCGEDAPVMLPNVDGRILEKIITYCTEHKGHKKQKTEDKVINTFDQEYINNFDKNDLFSLILASNYLDIKDLLDLSCTGVANKIKGKNVEEIREAFRIVNDFTPEEEEQVKQENAWMVDNE